MAKNRCSACGQDFYRVEQFDAHRRDYRISRRHTAKECSLSISKGLHPKGECQVLIGACIPAEILGYHAEEGVWYDAEGLATKHKLTAAINRRWAKGVGNDGP